MLFSVLPSHTRETLLAVASRRVYRDGQLVHSRGDGGDGFWVIESGGALLGQFLAGGEFRSFALVGPGDSWGELAVLTGSGTVVEAVARGDTVLRYVPGAALESVLAHDPALMRPMLNAIALQLRETLMIQAHSRSGAVAPRLADIVLNLAGDGGPGRKMVTVTQTDLASLLGATRGTVNAALARFEAGGLIRRAYGKIEVLDRAGLRAVAEN